MLLSRYDTRALAVLALIVAAALLGFEFGDYFLREVHDVEARGGRGGLVKEFGSGLPIAQSFLTHRDGLRAITISIASDQAAVIAFGFTLVRKGVIADWPDEPIAKRVVQMSIPAGVTTKTIDFPPVSRAKERTFVATFQLTDAMRQGSTAGPLASQPVVGLSAWADDVYPGGALKVGGEDRWGDLNFSAQVEPPTRLQRMSDSVSAMLSPLHPGRFVIVVLFVIYGGLLAAVCYRGALTWVDPPQTTAASTVSPRSETPDRTPLPASRAVAALSLAIVTPLLLAAILITRERVRVNLLDQLDFARMESPLGLHGGFSRVNEVINGVSPPALFAHPPSRLTWTVPVPTEKPLFKSTVALRPLVWEHRSDGAAFKVSVSDGSQVTTVSRFLNPGRQFNDRAWIELDMDLSRYAGQTVTLTLTTSEGPQGDAAWDWALWGNPRIVSERWFDRYGRASRALKRELSGD